MHDGGTAIDLVINNKPLCSSDAVYDGGSSAANVDGQEWQTISKMTPCNGPIAVKRGDKIRLRATFDLQKHPVFVIQ